MKFPKSSGRQLDHRGTLSCPVSSSASKQPELELQGKYTESLAIKYLSPAGQVTSQREVFRYSSRNIRQPFNIALE